LAAGPWANSGDDGAGATAGAVIASTRPPKSPAPADAHLPLVDDGLKPLVKPTARPVPGDSGPFTPHRPVPLPSDPSIQRALYTTEPEAAPGRKGDPGVVPASVGPPAKPSHAREAPPAAPASTETSQLALELTGPATTAPGQTLNCVLIARNTGVQVLAGVRVELPLPDSVRVVACEPYAERHDNRLRWNLGNLDGGAERRVKIDLSAGEACELHLRPVGAFTVAVGLRSSVIRPPFSLTIKGPSTAAAGAAIPWKIQVGNFTNHPLQRVSLGCRLSAGLSHPQGEVIETELPHGLAPGEVHTIELNVQALRQGRQEVSLTASADNVLTAQAAGVILVNDVALSLAANGPRTGRTGEDLTFQLELTNPGSNTTGPVRLMQVLPEGVQFVSASGGAVHNPTTQTITWTLDALMAKQKLEMSFKVRANKAGDWALPAAVQAEGLPDVRTTHSVHISAPPALTLEAALHGELYVGGETTYEVRVYNKAPLPAARVRLRLIVPENLVAVQASAPGRWQIQGQQVLFEPVEEIRPHNAAVYRVRLRGSHAGMGRCRVELTADGLAQPMQHEITCSVLEQNVLARPGAGR
jgi:uncharacterized repeat protein (TIGR01451 family)